MANQKRISELPIINTLSGSAASVIPVVVGGTTNQISAENFSKFVNAYNATTSSNTFIGNQTITGNLVVSGDLTAERYYIETISSSVIYESGSTEFGNSGDDVHTFTGSIVLNGTTIGLGELNAQTASQNSLNTSLGIITSSIYGEITSIDTVLSGVSSVTSAFATELGQLQTQNTSQGGVNSGISAVTGAFAVELGSVDLHILGVSQQTASQDLVNLGISSVTGSLIGITNGLMAFTASLDTGYATDEQLYQLYQATRSLEIQTGSQNSINSGISAVTGAFATELSGIQNNITSFNNVFGGVSAVTGAFATELGQLQTQNTSQNGVNSGISAVTGAFATELGSIDSHILKQATQTGSQDLVNLGISSVTGSLIGITNGLMAFTAALDSTYATDAQVADAVAALNTQTGSQNSINSGISAVTGAFATELGGIQNNITSFNNVFGGVSAVTGAFATELGGIQTTLSGHRNELDGLESYTASLKGTTLISGSSQIPQIAELFTQNTSQLGVNLGISTFTGSLRDEVNGIEAYTASLKGAIEVSGQNVNVLGMITAQQFNVTLVSSSVMYQSGSTKFGDSSDDTHQFTGSLSISGSASVNGIGLNSSIRLNNLTDTTGNEWHLYSLNNGNFGLYNNSDGLYSFQSNPDGGVNFSAPITSSVIYGTKITTPTGLEYQVRNTNGASGDHIFKSFNTEILKLDGGTNVATFGDKVSIATTQSAAPLTIKEQGTTGAPLFKFYGNSSNGDYMRGYWTSQDGETTLAQLTVNGNVDMQFGTHTTAPLKLYTNATTAVEINYLAGANFVGAVTASNFKVPSGGGIDFSANANAAGMTSELLDDYEEGTWTPVISDGTNDATMTATYNRGQYIKVGKQVSLSAYVLTDSLGSVTGPIRITGIPFTNGSGYGFLVGGVAGAGGGLNLTAGQNVTLTISTGANYIILNVWDDAAGSTQMDASQWSADGQIQIGITYLTD